jgi:hypothetical protein
MLRIYNKSGSNELIEMISDKKSDRVKAVIGNALYSCTAC